MLVNQQPSFTVLPAGGNESSEIGSLVEMELNGEYNPAADYLKSDYQSLHAFLRY